LGNSSARTVVSLEYKMNANCEKKVGNMADEKKEILGLPKA